MQKEAQNLAQKKVQKSVFLVLKELEINEDFQKEIEKIQSIISANYEINATSIFLGDDLIENSLYLLYLSDEDIKTFFCQASLKNIDVAILPHEKASLAISQYGINKQLEQAITEGFDTDLQSKIDLLLCNSQAVFNKVSIGNMHGFALRAQNSSLKDKIKSFFKNLTHIKYDKLTIKTAKENIIQTAACGVVVVENTPSKKAQEESQISYKDGQLQAFILAPNSLVEYFKYLLLILFYQKISRLDLPKSISFIKTTKLCINSSNPLDYEVDKAKLCAKEITLEVIKDAVNLHIGKKFLNISQQEESFENEKETISTKALPKGEINDLLASGFIPLFKKAAEEDFRDLFTVLRTNAKLSNSFLILMVLSTLLASVGLFQNSGPVIIGAMILAPLMAPIISLAMGLVRLDKKITQDSVKTLAVGIFFALFVSSIFTSFTPLEVLTPEMASRINPNLLDLFVAIFSGIAGAYANSKEEIAKSLAGVAIAVALVPPLSVTGIGIGWMDFEVIYGSFLLFATNLIGITLAASISFIVLGYAPVKRAKRGVVISSLILAIIAVPLVFSFETILLENKELKELKQIKTLVVNKKEIFLKASRIKPKENQSLIDIELSSRSVLESQDLERVKEIIAKKLKKDVLLNITLKVIA